jgi:hypothetical protein
MTLGQPMMIGPAMSRSVPLPAAIDDEFLSLEQGIDAVQPANIPSKTDFYVQTLKLYIILEEILNGFYSSGVSDELASRNHRSAKEGLDELDCNLILRIDRSLTQWFQDIPEHLVWRPKHARGDAEELFVRQSNVLHLRYTPSHECKPMELTALQISSCSNLALQTCFVTPTVIVSTNAHRW